MNTTENISLSRKELDYIFEKVQSLVLKAATVTTLSYAEVLDIAKKEILRRHNAY